ncbi:MAG: C45 family peptidase [Nanoarchaeota archaeon]|nr:C45 family peptidase [Nanoarchaeota archaeon]
MGKIPLININAKTHSDFGFKFGSKLKKQIQFRLKKNKEMYSKYAVNGRHFSIYVKKAKKFLPKIEKNFPHLLEEAKAMAEGAEVPFEELFVLMTDEEIVTFKMFQPLHCTSLAIRTQDDNILLGHNEDWFSEYRRNGLALVNARIKNTKFLSLGYLGSMIGTSSGLNNHGIAYADDSLSYTRFTYDVPRSFHLRALSEVKTPLEAKKVLDKKGSIVSSTLVVKSNKIITNVEELWNKEEFFTESN